MILQKTGLRLPSVLMNWADCVRVVDRGAGAGSCRVVSGMCVPSEEIAEEILALRRAGRDLPCRLMKWTSEARDIVLRKNSKAVVPNPPEARRAAAGREALATAKIMSDRNDRPTDRFGMMAPHSIVASVISDKIETIHSDSLSNLQTWQPRQKRRRPPEALAVPLNEIHAGQTGSTRAFAWNAVRF